MQGVAEALDEFNHLDVLPNKIFVAGGGAALPEIKSILSSKLKAAQLPFTKKPLPALISPTDIPNLVLDNQIKIDLGDMVVLGLAQLAFSDTTKEDIVGNILHRIVLNMQG